MKNFLTASELSRSTGFPLSRITAAIEAGTFQPDGRAGSHPNSAFIFDASRVEAIAASLASGNPAPAPKMTTALSEITGKAQAIRRAKLEGRQ